MSMKISGDFCLKTVTPWYELHCAWLSQKENLEMSGCLKKISSKSKKCFAPIYREIRFSILCSMFFLLDRWEVKMKSRFVEKIYSSCSCFKKCLNHLEPTRYTGGHGLPAIAGFFLFVRKLLWSVNRRKVGYCDRRGVCFSHGWEPTDEQFYNLQTNGRSKRE